MLGFAVVTLDTQVVNVALPVAAAPPLNQFWHGETRAHQP
jgi:hypothetical protein